MSVSRTAVYVAAGRAIGAREPDAEARNPDDLAEKLLGDPADLGVDHPVVRALASSYDEAMEDPEVVSNVRMMIVRTRFIDEALARAVAGGAEQLLILGAGFDSHAWRCRELLAGVRVFEADRPDMQLVKQERVNAVLGGAPANLRFVPIDLERQSLQAALTEHGYDFTRRSFVIMEGLTMYLDATSLREVLLLVSAHPAGSSAVFDFVSREFVALLQDAKLDRVPAAARPYVQRFLELIRNEPWRSGLPAGGEQAFLAEFGLESREILAIGSEDAALRYLTRADGSEVGVVRGSRRPRLRAQPEHRFMAYSIADVVVAPSVLQ